MRQAPTEGLVVIIEIDPAPQTGDDLAPLLGVAHHDGPALGVVLGANRVAEADRCICFGVDAADEEGRMRFPNENFFFFSDFGADSVLRAVSLSNPVNLERLFPRDMGLAESSLVPCVDGAPAWV